MNRYRIFDDRTNETILESEDKFELMVYLSENYDEDHPDFEHVWIEEVKI